MKLIVATGLGAVKKFKENFELRPKMHNGLPMNVMRRKDRPHGIQLPVTKK